jgi:hypothetical protein
MKGASDLSFPMRRIRSDRRGAAEMMQVMQAVLVAIVCVGIVFAALAARSTAADEQQASARAANQAALLLEAIPRDAALAAGGGAVSWIGILTVASGEQHLSFVPQRTCSVTIQDVESGVSLFLHGNADALSSSCVFVRRPVPIAVGNGTTHPGLLTAGVARQ